MIPLIVVVCVVGGIYVGWWAAMCRVEGWIEQHPTVAHTVAVALVTDAAVARLVAKLTAQYQDRRPGAPTQHTRYRG